MMNTVTANGAFVYSLAMSAIFDVKGLIIMSGMAIRVVEFSNRNQKDFCLRINIPKENF